MPVMIKADAVVISVYTQGQALWDRQTSANGVANFTLIPGYVLSTQRPV